MLLIWIAPTFKQPCHTLIYIHLEARRPRTYPTVPQIRGCDASTSMDLATGQACGVIPAATVYKALQEQTNLTWEQLEPDSLWIRAERVMEIQIALRHKPRYCTVCPPSFRQPVFRQTHTVAHSGMKRTLSRLKLNWYWPGMTVDVRRTVRGCEVYQTAKHGGIQTTHHRQRMYPGGP